MGSCDLQSHAGHDVQHSLGKEIGAVNIRPNTKISVVVDATRDVEQQFSETIHPILRRIQEQHGDRVDSIFLTKVRANLLDGTRENTFALEKKVLALLGRPELRCTPLGRTVDLIDHGLLHENSGAIHQLCKSIPPDSKLVHFGSEETFPRRSWYHHIILVEYAGFHFEELNEGVKGRK